MTDEETQDDDVQKETDRLIRLATDVAVELGLNHFPRPGPAFDLDDEPVRRWVPPTTNEDDEAVLDILPDPPNEFAFQHTEVKARLRELPEPLHGIVRKLRTDFLRLQVLDRIEARIVHEAMEAGVHKSVIAWAGAIDTTWHIPAIRRHQILRSLAGNPKFVQEVKDLVSDTLKQGHVHHVWRSWPRPLPKRLPVTKLPSKGSVTVESWVGLGAESLTETAPEGLLVLLARRVWRPYRGQGGVRREERSLGWILHAGALASTFTLALIATAPAGLGWDICELDTAGEPLSIPWIRWRSHELPTKSGAADMKLEPFKVAFLHVPPPGVHANQIRNRAKDLAAPPHEEQQRRLPDLGRLGPRKWRKELRAHIKEVIKSLDISGELFLLLPTATRTTETKGGRVEWRYEPDGGLLVGVRDLLLEEGLAIEVDVEVVERNPVRQAFFAFNRCPWTLIIARRPRPEDEFEDDSDIEAILRGLEDEL